MSEVTSGWGRGSHSNQLLPPDLGDRDHLSPRCSCLRSVGVLHAHGWLCWVPLVLGGHGQPHWQAQLSGGKRRPAVLTLFWGQRGCRVAGVMLSHGGPRPPASADTCFFTLCPVSWDICPSEPSTGLGLPGGIVLWTAGRERPSLSGVCSCSPMGPVLLAGAVVRAGLGPAFPCADFRFVGFGCSPCPLLISLGCTGIEDRLP